MSKIKFSARISKQDLRRIYEDDAKGLHDAELIDEIGTALYLRCCDILAVKRAKEGSVRCQDCWNRGEEKYIERPKSRSKAPPHNEAKSKERVQQRCNQSRQ